MQSNKFGTIYEGGNTRFKRKQILFRPAILHIAGLFFIQMITVNQAVQQYCAAAKLPPPSQNDLKEIGRIVSHHFRTNFVSSFPAGPISGAGFTKVREGTRDVVVAYYPHNFIEEVNEQIELFYQLKQKRIEEVERSKKEVTNKVTVGKVAVTNITQGKRKRFKSGAKKIDINNHEI